MLHEVNRTAIRGWKFENSYTSLPTSFYTRIAPTPVHAPQMVIWNHLLATSLGLEMDENLTDNMAAVFSGNHVPDGAEPLAQAYAGHQFGHFAMLGDGRAHLLGEHLTPEGMRVDIQLKGSGSTPYSRRGDGRAALAPMLREYLMSEAMHALGIPTTRSLAVVKTGEPVFRETAKVGAVLTRIAASHLRVGTFEYAAAQQNLVPLRALADYAIARHDPLLASAEQPYLAFLRSVIERQATLVASWMLVGFVHGVMNTDNMSISGETIDYGPCAFMDHFAMDRVFSSIDHQGRYAYGQQARIAQWNLARFAEALLPLLDEDEAKAEALAEEALAHYSTVFNQCWLSGMRKKLGLFGEEAGDLDLFQSFFEWMQITQADFTISFRDLIDQDIPVGEVYQSPLFHDWHLRWRQRLARNPKPPKSSKCLMRASNPVIIPRNQHVEDALEAAEQGDMAPFHALLKVVQYPYEETEENRRYRTPPPHAPRHHQTYCGT